jgi:hypothetical protein
MDEAGLLANIPELSSSDVVSWITQQSERARRLAQLTREDIRSIDGQRFEACTGPLGCYGERAWRAFALTALVADWASYETPADRVDFARLLFVLHRFPRGFRVWFGRDAAGFVPVGYTGWYPIEQAWFERIASGVPPLVDRGSVPLTSVCPGGHLYLFNYSLAPRLKSPRDASGERHGPATPLAAAMMKSYAREIAEVGAAGLAAITVSTDGARLAERFGMQPSGQLELASSIAQTYATRA